MFESARDFNNGGSPSIGNWDTSNIYRGSLNGGQLYGMHGVFNQAVSFNQDISSWCVSNIPTKPHQWTGNQTNLAWRQDASKSPQWGTCPTGISTPTGAGTVSNPYLISTLGELRWISQDTNRWGLVYKQTANIDADPSINLNNRAGLIPIGNTSTAFTGKYNGQGFWIDDLHINRSSSNEIGLFVSFSNSLQ